MRRVLLLTDGHANAGITDPALLAGLCGAARAQGITTSTIGFGDGYDEALLRAMADAGGGSTYYVERVDQAAVFAEEVDGLLALAAQNVAVEVRPGPAVELVAVHHDYPQLRTPDGVRVELGDLYAHEPRVLLLEFLVAGGADAAGARAVAELVVHGHVLRAGGAVERRRLVLPVTSALAPEGAPAPEVTNELLLLAAARARDEAVRARERGDYAAGAEALRAVAAELAACPPAAGAGCEALAEEAADLAAMAARFDAERVSEADAKYLGQMAYASRRKKAASLRTLRRE